MFESALLLVSAAAGAIAAVAGFGVGSLLTPLLALHVGTKTAVAAVSVPHLVGTSVRLWLMRANIDRALLWRFGLTSAVGGLVGALLHEAASSRVLAMIFGALLVFAGVSEITGYARRWRFHGSVAWVAGAASGLFGGLVGNQGGIRSAAMLGFDVPKERFVATATASALFVLVLPPPSRVNHSTAREVNTVSTNVSLTVALLPSVSSPSGRTWPRFGIWCCSQQSASWLARSPASGS